MTRMALLGAGVVALAIGASAAALAHAQGATAPEARAEAAAREPQVLDRLSADFVEDERTARVLAALEAHVLRHAGRTWLRITASPAGPRVVAPQGALGVAGSNRLTAEEIAAAIVGARLEVRAQGPRGTTKGRALVGEVRDVLERRLLPDGRVEHVVVPFAAPSREAWFEIDVDGDGRHEIEVLLDGRVRVRAVCHVRAGVARMERLESVSAHEGDES